MESDMQFKDLKFEKIDRKFFRGDEFIQAKVHFSNGYGVSVVRGFGTYGNEDGLYEVAVLFGDELCYDSGLTEDVVGWLDEDGVTEWLGKVEALEARQ